MGKNAAHWYKLGQVTMLHFIMAENTDMLFENIPIFKFF